jgi:hypothetical protein
MTITGSGDILALAKGAALLILSSIAAATAVELMYLHPDVLVSMVARMQTVEVGNTKIAFGDRAYAINPDLKLSVAQQMKIRDLVKTLSPNEFDRLMHLTEYDKAHLSEDDLHCDFDMATSRMRLFSAADAGLVEKELVEKIPASRTPVVHLDPRDKNAVNIGNPSNCYQMALTDEGRNLKSVLVSELTRAFGNINEDSISNTTTVPKSISTRKQPKEAHSMARLQREAHLQ